MGTNPNPYYRKNILAGLSVPASVSDPQLRKFLSAVKQHLEGSHGSKGQPKERFVTLDDLQKAGLATVKTIRGRGEIVSVSEATGATATTTSASSSGVEFNDGGAAAGDVFRYHGSSGQWRALHLFDGDDNIQLEDDRRLYLGSGSDAEFYHDGADLYIDEGLGDILIGAAGEVFLETTDLHLGDSVSLLLGDDDDALLQHDGSDLYLTESTGNLYLQSTGFVSLAAGTTLRVYNSGDTDFGEQSHDGTDYNWDFTNTTDLNITGITTIQAGSANADFDAITATSYGGITEANLLDKTATETVSGTWTFTAGTLTVGNGTGSQFVRIDGAAGEFRGALIRTASTTRWGLFVNTVAESGSEAGSDLAVYRYNDAGSLQGTPMQHWFRDGSEIELNATLLDFNGAVDISGPLTLGGNVVGGSVDADFDAITATSYGGITEANLLDKTATETVSGTWTFTAGTLTVGNGTGSQFVRIDGAAGEFRGALIRTASTTRWGLFVNTVAESGSEAGSDLAVYRYNDAGSLQGTPMQRWFRDGSEIELNATAIDINGTLDVSGDFTIAGGAAISSSDDIVTSASGSFTGTLTGYSSGPTGTVNWKRTGNRVTLMVPTAITGTSNATTMTMTGLPAAITPTTSQIVMALDFTDNGTTNLIGRARLTASSTTVTFGLAAPSGSTLLSATGNFTSSGTKGLSQFFTMTYDLD